MAEISVIIPTYNRKELLVKLLESLWGCSPQKDFYEIIVIVDGSTDGTNKVIVKFQKEQPNLRYKAIKNSGPGIARNIAVELSSGKILAFLDDDCYVAGKWLEEVKKSFTGQEIDLVFGKVLADGVVHQPFFYSWDLCGQHICSYNIAIKKDVFFKMGGFDPVLSYWAEDWDFVARLKRNGARIVYNPNMVVYHAVLYKGFHLKDYIYTYRFWRQHDYLFFKNTELPRRPFYLDLFKRNIKKVFIILIVFFLPIKLNYALRVMILLIAVWIRNLIMMLRINRELEDKASKIKLLDALRFIFTSLLIDPLNLMIFLYYSAFKFLKVKARL